MLRTLAIHSRNYLKLRIKNCSLFCFVCCHSLPLVLVLFRAVQYGTVQYSTEFKNDTWNRTVLFRLCIALDFPLSHWHWRHTDALYCPTCAADLRWCSVIVKRPTSLCHSTCSLSLSINLIHQAATVKSDPPWSSEQHCVPTLSCPQRFGWLRWHQCEHERWVLLLTLVLVFSIIRPT